MFREIGLKRTITHWYESGCHVEIKERLYRFSLCSAFVANITP
jgi:hypothetical protein